MSTWSELMQSINGIGYWIFALLVIYCIIEFVKYLANGKQDKR